MCGRGQATDAHLTDRRAGRGSNIILKLFGAGHPCAHLWRNTLSKFGQCNAAAIALKQPSPARLLKFADSTADVRLARSIRDSHLAETSKFGSIEKKFPCGVIHRPSPVISIYL